MPQDRVDELGKVIVSRRKRSSMGGRAGLRCSESGATGGKLGREALANELGFRADFVDHLLKCYEPSAPNESNYPTNVVSLRRR